MLRSRPYRKQTPNQMKCAAWLWRMRGLIRDGTTVSRDQILRRERVQEKMFLPVQLPTSRTGNQTSINSLLQVGRRSVDDLDTF